MVKHFYFYDLPRTGGTCIKRWSRHQPQINRLHYGTKPAWNHVPFRSKETLQKELNFNKPFYTFTILRDPVDHTVSLYAKIRNHKHAYRDKFKNLTFDQWIMGDFREDVNTCPEPWGFSMVRFYDPNTAKLNQAIQNIKSVDFMAFTERLNADMEIFLKQIGSKIKFSGQRANASKKDFIITDIHRRIIHDVRADDYELVNYFRKQRNLNIYE